MVENKPIIALIGAGMMGEAIIVGLIRQDITDPANIRVFDPKDDRINELIDRYQITGYANNLNNIQNADIIILAVKPQNLDQVYADLKGNIPEDALVLSIVAGVTIQGISSGLGHSSIVRTMPNTPAQIGKGITVWTNAPQVSPEQLDLARQVILALGEEVHVDDENYMDMATALSGTGPAYVFLFMEAMIDAGVHLGFPRSISEKLVTQTVRGSVDYYAERQKHPARLRNEVTSPGGTSAAAIYYLEKAGVRTAFSRAIWAAYERSKELGEGKSSKAPDTDHN
jgi:pyrroline-5-carboxylate reductase